MLVSVIARPSCLLDAAYAAALYIEYEAPNLIKSRRVSRGVYGVECGQYRAGRRHAASELLRRR